jgi:hypothetical protein
MGVRGPEVADRALFSMRRRCKARAVVAGRVDERGNNRPPLRASEVMRLGEMWNGGAAASIVPPTIYPPAGPATQFPPGFLRAAAESAPAGRWAALLRSEAGR